MALPQIKLDERTFQDLVDEAKRRIPRYCPEWTNHNISDPGVTLIELFAYMVDQLLYQVNRVPEKNYRTFLNMIGVQLAPPNAARAEVTFRLSAAQPNPLVIPRGSEISTVRTETQPARIFTTEEDLVIAPPRLQYVLTTTNLQNFENVSSFALDPRNPKDIQVFAKEEPRPDNAFYLGFDQSIASQTIVVALDCENLGVGINPLDPPIAWEYWDSRQGEWLAAEIARDTTEGLTVPYSEVEIFIPSTSGQREVGTTDPLLAAWLRCRYLPLAPAQAGYVLSPVIRRFSVYSIGGTISAAHSQTIRMEELGRSKGEPGQRFRLQNYPVLALDPTRQETVLVDPLNGSAIEVWKHVPDFSESNAEDKHFIFDPMTGELAFGPAIRNPQGVEEQLGAIPPEGSRILMAAYRTGGGSEGNVGAYTITNLRSSIPYVDRVFNIRPAAGGTSAETLDMALMRGPRTLRARNRAVTIEDFEVLTRQATSGVARVRCLTPTQTDKTNVDDPIEPGTVVLVVVPEVDDSLREIRPEHLNLTGTMRAAISDYLDERRLITTHVKLTTPNYQWVTVQARIKTINPYMNERVKKEAERRLYRFIRPVNGGPDPTLRFEEAGEGWGFGRILYSSEIYPILQTIEGVEFIERVDVFPVTDLTRAQAGAPVSMVAPGPRGLLCSYRHQIVIV
jgi:predicted phage baseplate assembly protein